MCLITVAKKGSNKDSEALFSAIKNGFRCNDDGSGYAIKYADTGKIYISKGYWDVKIFTESIKSKKLVSGDELIIHHRIGTSGEKNDLNTHPFVVSTDHAEVVKLEGYVDNRAVIAHNGIFSEYSDWQSKFSDTCHFTHEFMTIPEVYALLKRDPVLFAKIHKDLLSTNKLAILFPDKDLEMIGNFVENEGLYHSNTGYKDPYVRNVGGFEHNNRFESSCLNDVNGWRRLGSPTRNLLALNEHITEDDANLNDWDNEVKVKITGDNYTELVFKCVDSTSKMLEYNETYTIDRVPKTMGAYTYVRPVTNTVVKVLQWIKVEDLYAECILLPKDEFKDKYKDYALLKKNYPVSKTSLKKLRKRLDRTPNADNTVNLKSVGVLNRDAVKMFYDEYVDKQKKLDLRDSVEQQLSQEYSNFYD